MKKIFALILFALMVFELTAAMAEAPASTPMPETGSKTKKNGALVIDYSHIDQGYVMVKAAKGKKKLKVQVKAGDNTLTYDLNNSGKYEVFPLQYGSRKYTFTLWKNRSGKTYEENGKITLTAKMPDELTAFLYPNQYVNYNPETDAVVEAGKICSKLTDQKQIYKAVCDYMKSHFAYDHIKAAGIGPGKLPQIDDAWNKRMGICQDLSAIMVAMLRSQGVPARLMIGTLKGGDHAWVAADLGEGGFKHWFDPTSSLLGVKAKAKDYKVERYY